MFKKVLGGIVAVSTATATSAMAAVDLTGVAVDTTTVETMAATILIGLGIIWGIRKLIKVINRS